MHYCFFGSSLTEQHLHHSTGEITGYVTAFEKKIHRIDPRASVSRVAQGGSHINYAGIALLDNVISLKPDVCFLDWHSTGLAKYDLSKYLMWICYSLSANRIFPIVLISPRRDRDQRRSSMTVTSYKLAAEYSLEIIDLTNIKWDLNLILRDDVHTNTYGADRISHYVLKCCQTLLNLSLSQLCLELECNLRSCVAGYKFFTSAVQFKSTATSTLSWNCKLDDLNKAQSFGATFTILLEHIVGPHSPPYLNTHISASSAADSVSSERGFRSISYNTDVADIYSQHYSRKTITVLGDGLWMDVPIQINISIDPAYLGSYVIPLRLFVVSSKKFLLSV